jgi:hypothetical protein
VEAALYNAKPEEIILVAGSIFVAAGARIAWLKHYGDKT